MKELRCVINRFTRCGRVGDKDYGKCPDGLCCSKLGLCSNVPHYCFISNGCKRKYGKCIDNRCGKEFGKCSDDYCCSEAGYCGKTSEYCSPDQGCQKEYGKCDKKAW